VTHEVGKFLVSRGELLLPLEQLPDRRVRLVGLYELMMGHRSIEEQRFGRHDVARRQPIGPGNCFVIKALLREPASKVEAHVIADEQRRVAVGQPGKLGQLLSASANR